MPWVLRDQHTSPWMWAHWSASQEPQGCPEFCRLFLAAKKPCCWQRLGAATALSAAEDGLQLCSLEDIMSS